jgi:hypothetical protein
MPGKVGRDRIRIDPFFAGPGARADQWYRLVKLAESWSRVSANRDTFEAALAELTATRCRCSRRPARNGNPWHRHIAPPHSYPRIHRRRDRLGELSGFMLNALKKAPDGRGIR